jgi:hypothetical protein
MDTDELSSKIISNPEYLTELYSLIIAAAKLSKTNNGLAKIFVPFNTEGQIRFSVKKGEKGEKDDTNKIEYNTDDITIIGGAATMIYENYNTDSTIESIKRKTLDMDIVWWPRVSGPKTITHAIVSKSEIIKDFVEQVKNNLENTFKALNGRKYIIDDAEYTIKEVNIQHKMAVGYGTNQMTIILKLESGESINVIDFSIYDSASAQTPGTTDQRKLEKNYLKNKSPNRDLKYETERSKWVVYMIRPMQEDPVYMTSISIPKFKSSTNNAAKYSNFYSKNINKDIIINGQQINVPTLERLKEQQEFILSNIKDTNKNSKSSVYEERLKFINSIMSKNKKVNGPVNITTTPSSLLGMAPNFHATSAAAAPAAHASMYQYPPAPQSLPIVSPRFIHNRPHQDPVTGEMIHVLHNTVDNKIIYYKINPYTGQPIYLHPVVPIHQKPYYPQPHQVYQLQQQQMQKPIKCNHRNIIEEVYVNPQNYKYYRQVVCNTTNGEEVYSYEIDRKAFLEARKKGMKTLESGKMLPSTYTYKYRTYSGGNRTQKASKAKKQKTRKQTVGYANILSLDGKQILYKVPINLI